MSTQKMFVNVCRSFMITKPGNNPNVCQLVMDENKKWLR